MVWFGFRFGFEHSYFIFVFLVGIAPDEDSHIQHNLLSSVWC